LVNKIVQKEALDLEASDGRSKEAASSTAITHPLSDGASE